MPGQSTIELKTETLASLNIPIAAGIGNRASDVVAYSNAGLSPDRIFINLPEFTKELRGHLAAGAATPFDHYDDLRKVLGR
jgi:phosphatidate phosphatase PAH1